MNALLILDEEAECCAQRTPHSQAGGSSKYLPPATPEATATSDPSSSPALFQSDPQDSSFRMDGVHNGPVTSSPKSTPKPLSPTLIIERRHIALSCICNLCYIHLQRNDPHACITCANTWFRRPLNTPPVATTSMPLADSASGDMEWLQGVWQLLEDSLQQRRCVETAVHLAGYVGEALCMLAAPQAAVEVLLWGLSGLARRTARYHVRISVPYRIFLKHSFVVAAPYALCQEFSSHMQ